MMTPEQIYWKQQVEDEQKSEGTFVEDYELERYYVWVELPRTPDHVGGGEKPIDWTRDEDGGHL